MVHQVEISNQANQQLVCAELVKAEHYKSNIHTTPGGCSGVVLDSHLETPTELFAVHTLQLFRAFPSTDASISFICHTSTGSGVLVQVCSGVLRLTWCLIWVRRRSCCTELSNGMRASSNQLERRLQGCRSISSVQRMLLSVTSTCHTVKSWMVRTLLFVRVMIKL